MTPQRYCECLEQIAAEHDLPGSNLTPAMSVDLLAVERELGVTLPPRYCTFLEHAGCGEEFGGLAEWYHFDISMPGNIVEASRELSRRVAAAPRKGRGPRRLPRGFLAIYDSHDGDIFGFVPQGGGAFHTDVYAWNRDIGELRSVAPSFDDFLEYLIGDYIDSDGEVIKQS